MCFHEKNDCCQIVGCCRLQENHWSAAFDIYSFSFYRRVHFSSDLPLESYLHVHVLLRYEDEEDVCDHD